MQLLIIFVLLFITFFRVLELGILDTQYEHFSQLDNTLNQDDCHLWEEVEHQSSHLFNH